MKVLHIIDVVSKSSGGPARVVKGLCVALQELGLDISLISTKVGDELWFEGIRDYSTPEKGGLRYFYKYFESQVERTQPDLIHVHDIWVPQLHLVTQIARKKEIPYIQAPHGFLQPWALRQKWLKKQVALWVYQRYDLNCAAAYHVMSQSEADQLIKLGFNKKPIILAQNGVMPPQVMPVRMENKAKRRVLYLGRIHPSKGGMELIEAWAKVRPQGWDCEFVYEIHNSFECEYEKSLKARVKELGLDDQFVFTGPLSDEDKWQAYARANLHVSPTYSENFGITVVEALYAGVPVITTKSAPWAELEAYQCGRWIEVGCEPLVLALQEMMSLTDAERTAMGARGRKLVEEKYLWPAIAEKMKAAYKKIVDKRKGVI